jgi:hypothetical protein
MRFTILILIYIFSNSVFAGGPWLNKKKEGFFQLQSTFPGGAYNRLFLENGKELELNTSVLDYTIQAYLEYGITDKLNLISTLPFKYVSTSSKSSLNLLPDGNLSGLGNYKLGVKYRISDKNLKIATSVQSSLKTISKDLDKGLITGYDANTVGAYFHIGKGFSQNIYSFLDVGINIMSNNFNDYLDIHYELGYQIKPSLWTAFTLDLRESITNESYIVENLRQTALYTNNQEYFAFGFKGSYEFKNKIGFTAATFGAFSGNYVAKISTFSVGIYKKW